MRNATTLELPVALPRSMAGLPRDRHGAIYSAVHCPFLSTPGMVRRERGLPDDHVDPPGKMILRNPGVALVWTTKTFTVRQVGNGVLFQPGEPTETLWYAHGRHATRDEVDASITSGMPVLRAEAEAQGPAAVRELERMAAAVRPFLPKGDR